MLQTNLLSMLTSALAALSVACAARPPAAGPPSPEPASGPAEAAESLAERIRKTWNFDDPQQSEQRFRALAEQALARGDPAGALELQTQLARAQGLDQRFAEATATLAGVAAKLEGQPAVVAVRLRLEQGRVLNSSDQPELARPLFLLLRSFEGHTSSVDSVALSADGRRALSGSDDDTLKLWNVETGALVRSFEGHTDSVNSVALSADGRRATGSTFR
ncbi:MAG TPA: hypothetical protein VFS67_08440 [Polyangiaceae bacterium]|nr:hypothetical protein [Polyangiaceae bacterium]